VGAQAIVAFAVAAADYEYANTYRGFAREAKRLVQPGREVWFQGNWGWQRYALSAGFTLLAQHGALPRPGDLLIVPERVHKGELPAGLEPRLSLVQEKTYRGRIPIHTMDGFQHASFYAVVGRLAPYFFTRDRTLETFKVYRVKSEG
jgi:hypothetical protein